MTKSIKRPATPAHAAGQDYCASCERNDDPKAVLCLVNRLDQADPNAGPCFAYQKKR